MLGIQAEFESLHALNLEVKATPHGPEEVVDVLRTGFVVISYDYRRAHSYYNALFPIGNLPLFVASRDELIDDAGAVNAQSYYWNCWKVFVGLFDLSL